MSETTRLGIGILVTALLLGAAGDQLIMSAPATGLGAALWVALCVAGLLTLARVGQVHLNGEGRWLLIPAVLLGAAFLWRDSPALQVLDAGTLLVTLALAAHFGREGRLRTTPLTGYVLGILHSAFHALSGLIPVLLKDIRWGDSPRGRWSQQAAAVTRGLLIAFPLLLVFGMLFIAADAVFADLVAQTFDVRLDRLFVHLVGTGFWAWLSAGLLRATLGGAPAAPDPVQGPPAPAAGPALSARPAPLALGAVETGVVLGLLNALFLAFVLVQFRYFFGGADLVQASTTLTYAEYARRGFFELVLVSALVLPLLLLGHWLIPADRTGLLRLFRWLAGALIAQLFVIMGSAVQRMLLYQQEFGLTEQRLYATAFIGWLALLFVIFLATVLRDRRERFAFGALVSGLAVLGALHVLNPDGLIARVNVNRLAAGHSFDLEYVASLSADAVPPLVAALPGMDPAQREQLAAQLARRWPRPAQGDWRSWNWSRMQAYRLLD